mmetsp:Transcript_6746/g.20561  ORF Transcript_6746/g.20561 Transcript_6746/m.20561 type:complete len:326 (+) Transcript_6746:521-1498(+)
MSIAKVGEHAMVDGRGTPLVDRDSRHAAESELELAGAQQQKNFEGDHRVDAVKQCSEAVAADVEDSLLEPELEELCDVLCRDRSRRAARAEFGRDALAIPDSRDDEGDVERLDHVWGHLREHAQRLPELKVDELQIVQGDRLAADVLEENQRGMRRDMMRLENRLGHKSSDEDEHLLAAPWGANAAVVLVVAQLVLVGPVAVLKIACCRIECLEAALPEKFTTQPARVEPRLAGERDEERPAPVIGGQIADGGVGVFEEVTSSHGKFDATDCPVHTELVGMLPECLGTLLEIDRHGALKILPQLVHRRQPGEGDAGIRRHEIQTS